MERRYETGERSFRHRQSLRLRLPTCLGKFRPAIVLRFPCLGRKHVRMRLAGCRTDASPLIHFPSPSAADRINHRSIARTKNKMVNAEVMTHAYDTQNSTILKGRSLATEGSINHTLQEHDLEKKPSWSGRNYHLVFFKRKPTRHRDYRRWHSRALPHCRYPEAV